MPTPGLALIGFMPSDQALNFLKTACVPSNSDDAVLQAEWQAAVAKLGVATERAGNPEILPMPDSHHSYVQALAQQPWVQNAFQGQQISFGLVEIDPLLAFQYHVDTSRTDYHCGRFSSPPTLDEMLEVGLPLSPPSEEIHIQQQMQSLIVRSRSLNLRTQIQGMLTPEHAGIHFSLSLPLIHVVRFNGRCYLHNGFHRTYGIRIAGGTHVPCVIRDVPDAAAAGIRTDGGTFGQSLLESDNPPTLAHFTQDKAHPVHMRRMARIIHVTWADYVVPEE